MKPKSETGISRRDFLRMTATGAASAALGSLGAESLAAGIDKPGRKPNIVYVFSDEHRWCSLPFTETPQVVAPNMQRLAREGMCLDNCISNNPVCVPHRGMLITGRWPYDSGYVSNEYNERGIQEGTKTIAHTFKEAGYATGYVGKWHLVEDSVYNAGFDYHKNWYFGDDHMNSRFRDVPSRGEYQFHKGYNAIGMTDQALEFIKAQAGGDKPLMIMLSLNPPHWRWDDAPEEFTKLYPQDKLPYRPNVDMVRAMQDKHPLYYQNYLAHISAVDRELGRIMDALDNLAIADETILIYSSDHGSMFDSHGMFSKPGGPYDETHRVPFIIRRPGRIPANRRIASTLGAIDIYPTLCGLAGIKAPDFCGGKNLSHLVAGKDGTEPDSQPIFHAHSTESLLRAVLNPKAPNWHEPYRGVRTKRYTYAVGIGGEWLLIDNKNDPFQMKNLKDDPAYAKVKADLEAKLKAWLRTAEDPFIPAELRSLPIPERIAKVNEHYTRLALKRFYEAHKKNVLKPYLAADADAARGRKLSEAYDRIFGWDFYLKYHAMQAQARNISIKKKNGQMAEKMKAKAKQLEKPLLDQLAKEAKAM